MSGFSKLCGSIVTSSLWTEDHITIRVWVAMLATASAEGVVEGSIPGFANLARVTPEELTQAIKVLGSPDPYSRSPEHKGKRIKAIPGGWLILNYQKYRETNQEKTGSRAAYMRRYRKGRNTKTVTNVTRDTEAEAEAEAESPKGEKRLSPPRAKFIKPTIEEVRLAASKTGLPELEADKFFNHYEANGWVQGRAPVKSWPHCLAKWKLNQGTYGNSTQNPKPNPRNAAMGPGHTDYGAAARERANRTREGAQS